MFPEIRERFKSWLAAPAQPAVAPLELKGMGEFVAGAGPYEYERQGFRGIAAALGGGHNVWAGERVTIDTALNHSVVWACNRLISETVGMLPLVLLQKKGEQKQIADGHPAYSLLHDAPSMEMTAMSFRTSLTSHCVLGGNSYAEVIRRSGTGTAIAIHPLQPSQVKPEREKSGQRRLVYVVKQGNSAEKTYTVQDGKPHDIFHMRGLGWDPVVGLSVIEMARQSIGTALAAERNVASFYRNGGRLPYNLKLTQRFKTTQEEDQFILDWQRTYSEPHRAPLLYPNVDYNQTGVNARDSQLLETRLFDIHEICRWFLVSPHLVGDLSRATFCLPGEAEVYTEEGPRRIDQVQVDEFVWSREGESWVLRLVQKCGQTGEDRILTIRTPNRTLRCNLRHKVAVLREGSPSWTRAMDLRPGDFLLAATEIGGTSFSFTEEDGPIAGPGLAATRIESIELSEFDEPVYDLCVEGNHNFVADLVLVHNSNIESLALEFVKMTLSTWLNRWEQELSRCVLTAEERAAGYFFKHNLNALLRGDFPSRIEGYSKMLQNGIACIDEVRDLEDWNPAPGGAGKDYHIQLNQQTLGDGVPMSSQDAGVVALGQKALPLPETKQRTRETETERRERYEIDMLEEMASRRNGHS